MDPLQLRMPGFSSFTIRRIKSRGNARALCACRLVLWLGAITVQASPYFENETRRISDSCLTNTSLAEWQAHRPELQREAAEMLGLDPMPKRTDLKPVITGTLQRSDFIVEKVEFQSVPGLYVTGNLYLPRNRPKPAPAILYLCGHLGVISNGISYGNKTAYQHHGIWFARNGYVCLVIDTLEFGEIQGNHKGTYRLGMWWWNSRGYTPAGVETWNAMRALDYLASRPEVDAARLGVTGRSGGGAYSWFLAAIDDRVKVIAPVAGLADLQSYAVDGTVDSHCDCMFLVNTYRWDYPMLAALCAPRPLLLANSDADALFPLDAVLRVHAKIKKIYDLYGASTNFGLVIAPGPHRDVQDLQLPVLRWFNIHLKQGDPVIDTAAVKLFSPRELRVFDRLPAGEINTRIENSFVPLAPVPAIPSSAAQWRKLRAAWLEELRKKCFAGWPQDSNAPPVKLELMQTNGLAHPRRVVLRLSPFPAADDAVVVDFSPRGGDGTGLRRRFMLVGQTLDGMRVWDIRRAIQTIHSMPDLSSLPLWIEASGNLGVDALYASLFESDVAGLDLRNLPSSHQNGPDYLNVLRILNIPQAAAMAAENSMVRLQPVNTNGWDFLRAMAASPVAHLQLEWEK
jgi:dienelactone hydrolase